jgi:hypothetical protein
VNRRDALKTFLAVPATLATPVAAHPVRTARSAWHTADVAAVEAALRAARDHVERFTGCSTWDAPVAAFEHAVVEDTLTRQRILFEPDGNLYVSDDYAENSAHHSLADIVADTLDLWVDNLPESERADAIRCLDQLAAALRAAAADVERASLAVTR